MTEELYSLKLWASSGMQRLSECMCLLEWGVGSRDVDGGGTAKQATTRVSQWLSIPTEPHDKDILVSIRNGRLEAPEAALQHKYQLSLLLNMDTHRELCNRIIFRCVVFLKR